MSQLNDLFDKTIDEMTDEELEMKIHSLKRLRIMEPKVQKVGTTKIKLPSSKTNKDKQLLDLISKLTPETIAKMLEGK